MKKEKIVINYNLDPGAYPPERAHEEDAGWDLRTPSGITVSRGGSVSIDTGVHVEIPKGFVGFLKSKSGLNVKFGLTGEGVIDSGYTGSIVCKIYNNGTGFYKFNAGEKITQLVFLPIPDVELHEVKNFKMSERGDNGFGSTGK